MLTKEKSKQVFKLKYLLLIPILVGMLFYTSCEQEQESSDTLNETFAVIDIENLTKEEETKGFTKLLALSDQSEDWSFVVKDKNSTVTFTKAPEGSGISGPFGKTIKAKMHIESKILEENFDLFNYNTSHSIGENDVPYSIVDEVPVFPGCEDETDKRACFNKMMQKHISKNFKYPQKAQELGIQGRVSAMFTITEDGSIQNIRMRGPDSLLENEVARIIGRLPKIQPGKQDGKAVRVPFSIPISFRLEQGSFNNFYDEKGVKESETLTNELFDSAYSDIPFSKVEVAPIFPDCKDDSDSKACFQKMILKHISKNFNYPKKAQEQGIQGRVAVLFIIAKDGAIRGIKTRGPDELLEEEAERIISRLPKMIPGMQKGEYVDVAYSIPITFKLK